MTVGEKTPEKIFRQYVAVNGFAEIQERFAELCQSLEIDRSDPASITAGIRARLNAEAKQLWTLLDKRRSHKVYLNGNACKGKKVLVIGAGPCGLRMAIELALLGARVAVVEMRNYISRNNVLHLWSFVIHDLKSIGAKFFHPKFATGSLDHINIRRLQAILLKICLLLGVEVCAPVQYKGLLEPCRTADGRDLGWRGKFVPEDHPLHQFEFDSIVAADGRMNSLEGFERKCFRGKLALGITSNFVNRRTREDMQSEEIGGLAYMFAQEFFDTMTEKTGIRLENFVYYKDDTHYFVVTARKQSLFTKGVLRQDFPDTRQLLSRENVDPEKLREYAREAADFSTGYKLNLEFARNHHDEEDVAIFDFTNMHQAIFSCRGMERNGHKLFLTIIGDTLINPFWPTGSGCARGFLSAFDAAYAIRQWSVGKKSPVEVIAEKENIFKLLSQTKPDNLSGAHSKYSLEPETRYGSRAKVISVRPDQVRHLFDCSDAGSASLAAPASSPASSPSPSNLLVPERTPRKRNARVLRRRRREPDHDTMSFDGTFLLHWFQEALTPLHDMVNVANLTTSWYSGMAFCALAQIYRPGSVDVRKLDRSQIVENNQKAFEVLAAEFGISPVLSPHDMASFKGPDRLALLSYLSQLQSTLAALKKPASTERGVSENGLEVPSQRKRRPSALGLLSQLSDLATGHSLTSVKEVADSPRGRDQLQVNGGRQRARRSPSPDGDVEQLLSAVDAEKNRAELQSILEGLESGRNGTATGPTNYDSPPVQRRRRRPQGDATDSAVSNGARPESPRSRPVSIATDKVVLRRKPEDSGGGGGIRRNQPERRSVLEMKKLLDGRAEADNQPQVKPRREEEEEETSDTSEVCCVCRRKLFVVERHSAHGYFFHRHCFYCATCMTPLRLGSSAPDTSTDGKVKFYCFRHAYSMGLIKSQYDTNTLSTSTHSKSPRTRSPHSRSRSPRPKHDLPSINVQEPSQSRSGSETIVVPPRGGKEMDLSDLISPEDGDSSGIDDLLEQYEGQDMEEEDTLDDAHVTVEEIHVPEIVIEDDKDDITGNGVSDGNASDAQEQSDDDDDMEDEEEEEGDEEEEGISDGDEERENGEAEGSGAEEEVEEDGSENDEDAKRGEAGGQTNAGSKSDIDSQDEDTLDMAMRYRQRSRRGAETSKTLDRHSRSLRLWLAFEVTRGLEEVEMEMQDVEERGLEIETQLRDIPPEDPIRPELMEEWMDVLDRKNELQTKESELMLKVKLLELQNRQTHLQSRFAPPSRPRRRRRRRPDADDADEEERGGDGNLEEVRRVTEQMDELNMYFKDRITA